MMRQTMKAGWLVVAAALVLGMTACSSEDTIAEEPTPQQPANPAVTADGKVHVTVGAGVGDGGQTRSLMTYNEDDKTRTLTFTRPVGEPGDDNYSPGDRLYIYGAIERNVRYMGGMLTITSTSDAGKSATFEGDLTVWKNNGGWPYQVDTEWPATQSGDPMTWYGTNGIEGVLVHAAAIIGENYTIYDDGSISFNSNYSLVTGDGDLVKKLMESAIYVHGKYDKTDKCFNLECTDPIFNCTISGLKAKQEYNVRIVLADNQEDYNEGDFMNGSYYESKKVTAAVGGTARFACSVPFRDEGYWVIEFSPDNDFNGNVTHRYVIGEKEIDFAKVYNVTKTAEILCPMCHSNNVTTVGNHHTCGNCGESWDDQD